MMRAKDLYADLDWTDEFKGQCVIYVMRYQDKNYVGSTADLRRKIHNTRRCLIPIGVTKCSIRVIEVVDLSDRYTREAFHIKRLKTLVPLGHNKTSSGKGDGCHNVLEKQKAGYPSIFKSTTWASHATGKCVLYILEYDSKRYVGTTLELRSRIGSHRRFLARRGITEGYVVHYEEIPVAERLERESAAIESWNTYIPAGHNKTKNGAGVDSALLKKRWAENPAYRLNLSLKFKAQWEDPAYRLNQTLKHKAAWKDPALRLKMKAIREDPDYRLNQSLKKKAMWEDPAFRLNQSLKLKAAHARKRAEDPSR